MKLKRRHCNLDCLRLGQRQLLMLGRLARSDPSAMESVLFYGNV